MNVMLVAQNTYDIRKSDVDYKHRIPDYDTFLLCNDHDRVLAMHRYYLYYLQKFADRDTLM
jgi:hypothetical protein